MKIALTKKLADTMNIKPLASKEESNPLFSWTANITKVWADSITEDMFVLVNHATRFIVAIYEFDKNLLKNIDEVIKTAISNTLLEMNLNVELVEEYMKLSGDVEFVKSDNRKASTWIGKAGRECAFAVSDQYYGVNTMVFSDTIGIPINKKIVDFSDKSKTGFIPYQKMVEELSKITGKQAYKYCAFELQITLNLYIYKATRNIIVPANIKLAQLHDVLQSAYGWRNHHLYDFEVFYKHSKIKEKIVPFEEDLDYELDAILMENHTLSEFLTMDNHIIYTYDMGDNWEHKIKLKKIIDNYDKESPFLLEAIGKTPPEDVGGIPGFIYFYEVINNPKHPQYREMKEWSFYWNPELENWEKKPRLLNI